MEEGLAEQSAPITNEASNVTNATNEDDGNCACPSCSCSRAGSQKAVGKTAMKTSGKCICGSRRSDIPTSQPDIAEKDQSQMPQINHSQMPQSQMPQKSSTNCTCGKHQDAARFQQELPQISQKSVNKCLCGSQTASTAPPPAPKSYSRCSCGHKLDDDYLTNESMPQTSNKTSEMLTSEISRPVTPKNMASECTCGSRLADDYSTRKARFPNVPTSPSVGQCSCGITPQENPLASETFTNKYPVKESSPSRYPQCPPDADRCELPMRKSPATSNNFVPICMQQQVSPSQASTACSLGGSTWKSPRGYDSSSQHTAYRAQSQSPSRTVRSCSCGQNIQQRPISQTSVREPLCPCCQKLAQQYAEAPPSESAFKAQVTYSETNFQPRSSQQIPLIPMNMTYLSSTSKCRCGEDVTENSSRALTPVTFPTETSFSTSSRGPPQVSATCCVDEEYYSLSSSDREEPCPCSGVQQESSVYMTPESIDSQPIERSRNKGRRQLQKTEKRARSESAARNVIILQLLHEVVHLINEEDSPSESTSCAAVKQKIRNIGANFNEDSQQDVGAFSSHTNLSSIKITFMPSGGDVCPRQCIEASESQQNTCPMDLMAQSQSIEMNCPAAAAQCCNVFISPSCGMANSAQGLMANYRHVGIEAQSFINWKPGSETVNYAMEGLAPNAEPIVCEPDIMLDELGNPMIASTSQEQMSCGPNTDECAEECLPDLCPMRVGNVGDGAEQYPDMEQAVNGTTVMRPSLLKKLQQLTATPVEVRTEVAPLYAFISETNYDEEECDCDFEEESCQFEMQRHKKPKNQLDCDCCHCRAMREVRDTHEMPCRAITSSQPALENGGNCEDLKYFIDSIIMDLDAMEHARRNKQNRTLPPKKNAICGRESFPVTITDVTELGSSSLYVKWCIHDCYGIGGYEIYVDGHLTNRYFHCNHEAAVICDVSVTDPHKIVLLAQPKVNESYEEICSLQKENKSDINKSLAAKKNGRKDPNLVDNNGKDPNVVWIPSTYYYDPDISKSIPPNPMCSCVK